LHALARFCVARAWTVTATTLALVVLAGLYLAQNLDVDTNLDELVDPNAPFRERQRELNAAFPEQDDLLIIVVRGATLDARLAAAADLAQSLRERDDIARAVFAPAIMPFFVDNALLFGDVATLEDRLDRLAEAQPLLSALARDATPSGLAGLLADAFDQDERPPALDEAARSLAPVFAAAAAGDARSIGWLELAELGTGAAESLVIEVTPVLDFARVRPAATALAGARDLAAATQADHAGVEVALTGEIALEAEELEAAGTGAAGAGLASLVLVALVLGWNLRSAGAIVAVLTTLLAGLVATGAFAMWAVGAFSMISIAFAVLFIGLGVDFAIHVVLRAQEQTEAAASWRAAVREGAAATGPALLLCAPTTAVAFLSFTPTGYIGLAELGIIAAGGMVVALVLSLTLLPALLALLGRSRALPPMLWTAAAPRARRLAAVAVLALGLISLAGIGQLRFDGDPLALKAPTAPSVAAIERRLDDSGRSPYRAALRVADAEAAARAEARLSAVSEVGEVVTVASFVPTRQDEKLALIDDVRFFLDLPVFEPPEPADAARLRGELGRLAAAAGATPLGEAAAQLAARLERTPELAPRLAEAWFRYWPQALARTRALLEAAPIGRADLPAALVGRYVAEDGRQKVDILPAESVLQPAARRAFVNAVLAVAPHAAGNVVQMTLAAELVADAMVEASLWALAGVSLLVGIVLRRPREIAAVIACVLLAAALTIGAMAVFGLAFNFANVIVLPLLLGFGVDAAIHVVMRARETADPTRLGATSTPRAVLASALTTLASFGTLMLSPHQGTASMGLLLTIALIASLATALVALPVWLERRTST